MVFKAVAAAPLVASLAAAQVYQGFNYGSTFTTGAAKRQADFEYEFNAAKGIVGHSGFTSARLYTMIQAGTPSTPIEAIPAAISSKTSLLLGLWASAGQADFDNEIAALKQAISTYGDAFTSLIAGISIGSEDLYRITPTGIANKAGIGAQPDQIVSYINQVRGNISIKAPIGHVDTWTAWVNGSNSAVVQACDWIGMDSYPYFQTVNANSVENGASLFFQSLTDTKNAAQGKPVWITETGWAVSGPTQNQAVASVANAKTYWDAVACQLLGVTNTWWYTLQDAQPDTPSPSFGLVGAGNLGTNPTPLFDLTCPSGSGGASSAAPSAGASATSSPVAPVPSGTAGSVSLASTPTSIAGGAGATQTGSTDGQVGGSHTGDDGQVTSTIKSTSWSTVTACPASAGGDETITIKSTAYITEECKECGYSSMTKPVVQPSSPVVQPSSPVVQSSSVPIVTPSTTPHSTGTPAPAPSPSASSSACPADLNGEYQYPHLIVPVDKNQPNKAEGTSYFGYVNSTVSTIYNFDIPQSYAGKTCTLVFLFPQKSQLETSDYTVSGNGGLSITALKSPATTGTTYANQPASNGVVGSVPQLTAGNSYTITSGACPAGQAIAYEISATGDLNLSYFEDWNPSPLGLFIRTC